MAKGILKDVTILFASQDLSGDTNQINYPLERETKDATTFGSDGWREFLAGLMQGQPSFSGFRQAADEPDSALFGAITGAPLTVTVTNPVATGDTCYSSEVTRATYAITEQLGEIAAFSVDFMTTGTVARGVMLHVGDVTATADGSAREEGAATSTQKVYATLQVIAVSGTSPTLDVVIESDASDSWAGAETARITFDEETDATAGYQIQTLAGPVTDTWWRATFTVGGTGSPSFAVRLTLSIQ